MFFLKYRNEITKLNKIILFSFTLLMISRCVITAVIRAIFLPVKTAQERNDNTCMDN